MPRLGRCFADGCDVAARRRRGAEPQYIEIDPRELTGIFSVPQWLRDIGLMSWLLVGIAISLVGAVWLAGADAR